MATMLDPCSRDPLFGIVDSGPLPCHPKFAEASRGVVGRSTACWHVAGLGIRLGSMPAWVEAADCQAAEAQVPCCPCTLWLLL